MTAQFFCPRWGSENIQWDGFFKKVKEAGNDGIEYGIGNTASAKELDKVWNLALSAASQPNQIVKCIPPFENINHLQIAYCHL